MRVECIDALFFDEAICGFARYFLQGLCRGQYRRWQIFAGHQQRSREVSTSLTRRITRSGCASARL
jgi:hypothetical protein